MPQRIQETDINEAMINPRPHESQQNAPPSQPPRMLNSDKAAYDKRDTKCNPHAPGNRKVRLFEMAPETPSKTLVRAAGAVMRHSSKLLVKGPPERVGKGIDLALPEAELGAHLKSGRKTQFSQPAIRSVVSCCDWVRTLLPAGGEMNRGSIALHIIRKHTLVETI